MSLRLHKHYSISASEEIALTPHGDPEEEANKKEARQKEQTI